MEDFLETQLPVSVAGNLPAKSAIIYLFVFKGELIL